jgi:hypothetical protein
MDAGRLMQTFLPLPNFHATAEVLDYKRLGKQRVEAWQILRALRNETKGWVNHPATVMWRGHEQSLILYGIVICNEWIKRGYQDALLPQFQAELTDPNAPLPWWFGFKPLHLSHRSNLIRKDADYYSKKFDFEITPNNLPYVWCKPDGTFTVADVTKKVTKTLQNSLDTRN